MCAPVLKLIYKCPSTGQNIGVVTFILYQSLACFHQGLAIFNVRHSCLEAKKCDHINVLSINGWESRSRPGAQAVYVFDEWVWRDYKHLVRQDALVDIWRFKIGLTRLWAMSPVRHDALMDLWILIKISVSDFFGDFDACVGVVRRFNST